MSKIKEQEGQEEEQKKEEEQKTEEITITTDQMQKTLDKFKGQLLDDVVNKANEVYERRAKEFRLHPTQETAEKAEKAKGFEKTAKFLQALGNRDKVQLKQIEQDRITSEKYMTEGTDADGGYLVPTEFENEIIRFQNKYSILRQEFRVMTQKTDKKELNSLTTGVTAYIKGEGVAQTTTTKPTYAAPTLIPKRYIALAGWSSELAEDSVEANLVDELTREMARAINKLEEGEFIDGTTSGSEGILQVSGITSLVLGTGDLAFSDVTLDDFANLHSKVYAVAEEDTEDGKFLISMDFYNVLRQLKASTSGNYFFPDVPTKEAPAKLWGKPIIIDNRMPVDLGDNASTKIAAFSNWKRHAIIGDRRGIRVKIFDSGTIDTGGSSINLIEAESEAIRVSKRTSFTTALQSGIGVMVTAAS